MHATVRPDFTWSVPPLNNDVSPSAGDYSLYLRLLDLGHSELVKGLLEIVEKGLPTLPP